MTEQPKQPVECVLVEPYVEGVLVEGVLVEQQVEGILVEQPDEYLLDSNRFTVRSPNVYVNFDGISSLSPEEQEQVLSMMEANGFFR